jgi:hypothetical protein
MQRLKLKIDLKSLSEDNPFKKLVDNLSIATFSRLTEKLLIAFQSPKLKPR